MPDPKELNNSDVAQGGFDLKKMGEYIYEGYAYNDELRVWADAWGNVILSVELFSSLMESYGYRLIDFYPQN